MERADRFALLLHRVVLDRLLADPDAVVDSARQRLASTRERTIAGHESTLARRWDGLLDGPIEDLVRALVGLDEDSIELRSSTPFVGFSSPDERETALRASKIG